MHTCFIKELRTVGALGYCKHEHGRDFVDAAQLLASRPDLVDALITHRFPIEDAVEAYRVAADKSAGPGASSWSRLSEGPRAGHRAHNGAGPQRPGAKRREREEMSSNVMNHLGQCVTDLERSRTFYEEALGFTYWRTLELDDSPSDQLLQLQAPLGFPPAT